VEWLNYHHLLYFWTAAREGGVTRAAKKLRLAQPTVSEQIKRLEQLLGAELFERRGRTLVLSEFGRTVYGYADEIFKSGQELMNALERQPDTRMVEFVESDDFVPGATYRLLRVADGKIGMYQLLRGGGRLDSEFFPESIERRSWPNTFEYANFLRKRHVDYVMVWAGYDRRFRTNEHALLEAMVESRGDAPRVTLVDRTPDFDLYKVRWPRPVR